MPIIRCHHDADGIIAAYFTKYGESNCTIDVWNGEFGDTKNLNSGDIMVDMRPRQNMKGLIVIDHHGPYPDDREYTLYTGSVPASYLCWEKYKESIPKSDWWKLAIGLMGDGQPELIPAEVYNECPALLSKWKIGSKLEYNKWKVSYLPIYKLLSSYINSLLRTNQFAKALDLIKTAENPLQILLDPDTIKAKALVRAELENIMRTCKSYNFDDISVFIYYSDLRMSGYIASTMQNSLDKTILAINAKDGRGSLRGDLSLYFKDKLNKLDYVEIDGHPGFMGITVSLNIDKFISDLEKIL